MSVAQRSIQRILLAAMSLGFAFLVAAGCDEEPTRPIDGPDSLAVPNFSLTDLNPNSETFGEAVSPRDHLGHVSAWYFTQAT